MRLVDISESDQDIAEWRRLRGELYPGLDAEYDRQEIQLILHSNIWHCFFIIGDDEHIIGLVELSLRNVVDNCLTSPVAYLEGLYLEPEYRGQGRGRQLVNHLFAWCKERGLTELATDTELTNQSAQAFYKALGFQETDRVVEYRIEVE